MAVDGAEGGASSSSSSSSTEGSAQLSLADANAAAIAAVALAASTTAESKKVVDDCEALLGTFESRWVEIAEHVAAMGTTTKQFTEEGESGWCGDGARERMCVRARVQVAEG